MVSGLRASKDHMNLIRAAMLVAGYLHNRPGPHDNPCARHILMRVDMSFLRLCASDCEAAGVCMGSCENSNCVFFPVEVDYFNGASLFTPLMGGDEYEPQRSTDWEDLRALLAQGMWDTACGNAPRFR
jgi:hypothetical protein